MSSYLNGHSSLGQPTPLYTRQIMTTILSQPSVAGISVYCTSFPGGPCLGPPLFGGDRGCIVQDIFGAFLA